jgi:thioredoxin-dependent peroxiredoxin
MPNKLIGKVAPAFRLKNQEEEDISLKEFKGKKIVVLYFYPKAMTPGCTVQACGIRDYKKEFKSIGAVVLAVSPDEPSRLSKFEEKEELNFNLLSDPDHSIASSYGVWGKKKFMGREFLGIKRTTFIIGKNGKVIHVMDKVNTKTHHEDVLEWIRENISS